MVFERLTQLEKMVPLGSSGPVPPSKLCLMYSTSSAVLFIYLYVCLFLFFGNFFGDIPLDLLVGVFLFNKGCDKVVVWVVVGSIETLGSWLSKSMMLLAMSTMILVPWILVLMLGLRLYAFTNNFYPKILC